MTSPIIFETDFFVSNLWWIVALGVILLLLLYYLIDKLLSERKAKKEAIPTIDEGKYLLALGGDENIISHELAGSRIVLTLRSYQAVDKVLLREAGVAGFIEKSDKLTLVIKDNAAE